MFSPLCAQGEGGGGDGGVGGGSGIHPLHVDREVGVLFWVSFWGLCIYTSGSNQGHFGLDLQGLSWNAE